MSDLNLRIIKRWLRVDLLENKGFVFPLETKGRGVDFVLFDESDLSAFVYHRTGVPLGTDFLHMRCWQNWEKCNVAYKCLNGEFDNIIEEYQTCNSDVICSMCNSSFCLNKVIEK